MSKPIFRRRPGVLVAGAAILLVAATAVTGTAFADSADTTTAARAATIEALPADDPARGLIYGGLKAEKTGPCAGLYRVTGVSGTMCTHGPDAAPAGLDVKRPIPLLPARRAAAAAPQALAVCEGDGTSGLRVEVLYIHGSTSRYAQVLETLRTHAEGVDTIYNESARETGGERHVRFVTENVNGACRPVVRDVQVPDDALTVRNWAPLVNAMQAQGFTRTDRLYLQFVESTQFCGIGGFRNDSRKTDSNRSNRGPEYARVDSGCWNAGVAAHELGHNLGAVSRNAPNATPNGHCTDDRDLMCYDDDREGPVQIRTVCTSRLGEQRLDCNHDDYYHTNPPAGSYLANNFNVADNLFLIRGAPAAAE